MRSLRELVVPLLLAAGYFSVVSFATAAFFPALAWRVGFIAAFVAVAVYFVLVLIEREEEGMLAILLHLAIPALCLAAGVIWWVMKLTGFWDAIR